MNDSEDPKLKLDRSIDSEPRHDELGAIGISLGLTAFSAAIIFNSNYGIIIRFICLLIYILGGLSSSFLYFSYLIHKIPETMKLWYSKGALGPKGTIWIIWYYTKLLFRQMFTLRGNTIPKIRELGYLTILAMLAIFWCTFFISIIYFMIDISVITSPKL